MIAAVRRAAADAGAEPPSGDMMLAYDLLVSTFLVLSSPYYGWRMLTTRKYRAGLRQRLGFYPREVRERLSRGRWIWVHAVSLGEVNAVRPLLAELKRRLPDHGILVSTVTDTGQARARELSEADAAIYLPLDAGPIVRRLLRFFRPRLLAIAETEFWPGLVRSTAGAGIPVAIVNGRISDRSFPRYRRIRFLTRPMLGRMSFIGMQTEEDGRRARDLGAPSELVEVVGNLKFDSVAAEPVAGAERERLRGEWGLRPGERVVAGGSTWPGEEEALLDAHLSLAPSVPGLRLLLAPRHPERLGEVEGLIRDRGLSYRTRRGREHRGARQGLPPVLVLDTVGELARMYAVAEAAFVGKSLKGPGGQNPLEPAAQGAAVCFGPHMENFREIAPLLVREGGARVVERGEEVAAVLRELLEHPEAAKSMGERARRIVEANRGAASRTAERLLACLDPPSPPMA